MRMKNPQKWAKNASADIYIDKVKLNSEII